MRLSSLDSLRGIAAIVVVLHHCTEFIAYLHEDYASLYSNGFHDPAGWLYLTPLRVLVAGPSAVLIFFVLSGLVLSLSFIDGSRLSYPAYLSKRVCRIWLPFSFAILSAAALSWWLPQTVPKGTPTWFPYLLEMASWQSVITHLGMSGSNTILDPPMWTLIHELRISFIFPMLVAVTIWNWRLALIASITLCLLGTFAASLIALNSFPRSLAQTFQFIIFFILGIAISLRLPDLRRKISIASPQAKISLWSVALVGVGLGPKVDNDVANYAQLIHILLSGTAAALLVALCSANDKVARCLARPFPLFLGRISYSLYLIHWIVMAACIRLLAGFCALEISVVVGVVASIVAAWLVERYIERPALNLGRQLANKIDRRSRASGSVMLPKPQ